MSEGAGAAGGTRDRGEITSAQMAVVVKQYKQANEAYQLAMSLLTHLF